MALSIFHRLPRIAAALSITAMLSHPIAALSQKDDYRSSISEIADLIQANYFDSEKASQVAVMLRAASRKGQFAGLDSPEAFASALTEMLRETDRHFSVRYVGAPDAARGASVSDGGDDADDQAKLLATLQRENFGFAEVSILPGNVGFIEMRRFAPLYLAERTARAALDFIANTDAVIFDMRKNRGGEPSMVQFVISHFLDPAEPVIINTFVSRTAEHPSQLWSLPFHPSGNRPNVPLYVLTSSHTGSAGEAFPYHLQAMGRATVVGETTYGAGNPGEVFTSESGYAVFISTGSARNPVTGTNWEGTGVKPDVAADAARSLDAALSGIYGLLLEHPGDPDQQRMLEWAEELLDARMSPPQLSDAELRRYAGQYGFRSFRPVKGTLVYVREGSSPQTLVALGNHRFALPDDNTVRFVFPTKGNQPASVVQLHSASSGIHAFPRTGGTDNQN
jgi:hypothetical protein